jgi:integrase
MDAVAEGKTAKKEKTTKRRGLSNVRGGKGVASRTVGLLGAIFTYAVEHRMRADNPVRGVVRFADQKKERRLSDDEYRQLGTATVNARDAKIWPAAIALTRFLALTGWRSGEALALRWEEVDLVRRTATLGETKSGRSVRPLCNPACDVLREIGRGSGLVFTPTRGRGRMTGFPKIWAGITAKGELPTDITPHVLRHSFASLAADLGYSESTIAALIGHKRASVTSRYVHSADAVLLAAADVVAAETITRMGEAPPVAEVSPTRALKMTELSNTGRKTFTEAHLDGLRVNYEATKRPALCWWAIHWCLNEHPQHPLPDWCLQYLGDVAWRTAKFTGGRDAVGLAGKGKGRTPRTPSGPEMLRALGFTRDGGNTFRDAEADMRKARAAQQHRDLMSIGRSAEEALASVMDWLGERDIRNAKRIIREGRRVLGRKT